MYGTYIYVIVPINKVYELLGKADRGSLRAWGRAFRKKYSWIRIGRNKSDTLQHLGSLNVKVRVTIECLPIYTEIRNDGVSQGNV